MVTPGLASEVNHTFSTVQRATAVNLTSTYQFDHGVHTLKATHLRDASKSVCCFALVQRNREMRGPVATPKPATCLPCESPTALLLERPTGIWKLKTY